MTDIVITATAAGVPINALAVPPQITIRRLDTDAIVNAGPNNMVDTGSDGRYKLAFTPTVTLNYAFLVDADPTVTGQVGPEERFFDGSFPGNIDILADTGDLVNLDVAVSSRNAVTPLAAATDQGEHDATQAAIAAQVVPLSAAADQAEHDATQVGIGLNLAAIASLDTFIQGGREIDFVGDDAAGWQRVERDVGGSILRRYDLFDELDVRINETVATFIGRQGMISRETISP